MTKSEAIARAAEILRDEAEAIRLSHTITNEDGAANWEGEEAAQMAHDEMLAVAEALEQE